MAEFEYTEERVRKVIRRAHAIFTRKFVQALKVIRDSTSLEEIEALLTQRRFDEAMKHAETAATHISNAYVAAYTMAAADVSKFISNSVGTIIEFDQVNARAVREMQEASLRLIQEFTSGQRRTTRAALSLGIRRGLNPREQARLFHQSIGLTINQMQAVEGYRTALEQGSARALRLKLRDRRFDSTVRAAVNGDRVLSEAQIDRMVDQYYRKSVAHRAKVIAQTESLGAVHRGSDEGFRQAINLGLIDEELSQMWRTAGDSRVREPSHTFMNGQVRPFGEPFLSGTGNLLRYPGDAAAPAHDSVGCRCVKTTRFTADIPEPTAA